MKILYLCHPESDYGGSFLYNGFTELLGKENVVDFPPKLSYHGKTHDYPIPWYGGVTGHTAPSAWFAWEAPDNLSWDENGVRTMIKGGEFSFVVVESARVLSMKALMDLRGDIDAVKLPVVLMEAEDFAGFEMDKLRNIRPDLYLKRELRKTGYKISNPSPTTKLKYAPGCECVMIGFPFSCPVRAIDRITPFSESFDVFFACGNTTGSGQAGSGMRLRVVDALLQYADRAGIKSYIAINEDTPHTTDRKTLLPWDLYIAHMKSSKVLINCRGHGYDTARYWEAAGCGLLCTEELGLQFENQYTGDVNIIEFQSPEQCVGRVESLLSNEDYANSVRAACMAHTRQFHTNECRARQVVDTLKGMGLVP